MRQVPSGNTYMTSANLVPVHVARTRNDSKRCLTTVLSQKQSPSLSILGFVFSILLIGPPEWLVRLLTESLCTLVFVQLQVVTSQGDEVFFKIKTNTKLTKLRAAYAQKVGKDLNSIRSVHSPQNITKQLYRRIWSTQKLNWPLNRFLYDGNRINEDDTPSSLGMEDNDSIDVMVERQYSAILY
jgi:hypothetical protein